MSIIVKHFVKKSKTLESLQKSKLEETEKAKLAEIIVLIYHQKLLNRFLDNLNEDDKRILLEMLSQERSAESVDFLHEKIEKIESVVELALLETEDELALDLEELERLQK